MKLLIELMPLFIVRLIASMQETGELNDNGKDFVQVAPRVWIKVYSERK